MRSKLTRRSRVSLSARGEGCSPARCSLARTNRSIAPLGQAEFFAGGIVGRLGGMNAQCFSHLAPCEIHARSVSMSLDVNARPESTGGIRSSGSAWVMRLNNSLPLGLPAVMIAWPGAPVSSRRSALRLAASGPWHSKQFSERIGRTSRLNGTGSRATKELAKSHPASSSTTQK